MESSDAPIAKTRIQIPGRGEQHSRSERKIQKRVRPASYQRFCGLRDANSSHSVKQIILDFKARTRGLRARNHLSRQTLCGAARSAEEKATRNLILYMAAANFPGRSPARLPRLWCAAPVRPSEGALTDVRGSEGQRKITSSKCWSAVFVLHGVWRSIRPVCGVDPAGGDGRVCCEKRRERKRIHC